MAFKKGDKFILELGEERKMLDEFQIAGTDLYVKKYLLEKLTPYKPGTHEVCGMKPEIIKLIEENPDLPVIPMVDGEVVWDNAYSYWLGKWGRCRVTEYYLGEERVHLKDVDDEEDVLSDMAGCRYEYDQQGRYIYDLTDDEWDELYNSIPWAKCIAVYITT